MQKINHPYGNFRISCIKFAKVFFSKILRFIVSFLFNFKSNEEILISSAVYCPWKDDVKFMNFYKKIKNLTLLDYPRAYTLWNLSKNISNVKADILDVGCLLGGSGFLMSKNNFKGRVLLYDTFDGFKKNDGLHKKNIFKFSDIDFVRNAIKKLKLKNTTVYKKNFPNNLQISIRKIKLCHIDVNTYEETKKCFSFINKFIIRNGIIVFDDYGIWGVDGIKKIIKQISKKYKKKYHFIYNYMGQCILVKK